MNLRAYLTVTLFAVWSVSEVIFSLISGRGRSRAVSTGSGRHSYVFVWLSTLPPLVFAFLIRAHRVFPHGFGRIAMHSSPLGYLGFVLTAIGLGIRWVAVATLKGQFSEFVDVRERQVLVDVGVSRTIRHPAYFGHLLCMFGFGLASESWVGLSALSLLPLLAVLYRIRVEEDALLQHFGERYQEYANRTKRLLPGVF